MKEKLERLEALRLELGDIANSFAGKPHGCAAVELHSAAGRISTAIRIINEGSTDKDSDRQIEEWCKNQLIPMPIEHVNQLKWLMREDRKKST